MNSREDIRRVDIRGVCVEYQQLFFSSKQTNDRSHNPRHLSRQQKTLHIKHRHIQYKQANSENAVLLKQLSRR